MSANIFDLTNKVIIVTGAGQGLGAAHARVLARYGATLVLSDLIEKNVRAVASGLPGRPIAHAHDVSDRSAWQRIVDDTVARHGHIDGLVNNAGVHATESFLDCNADMFEKHLRINLFGAIHGMQTVIPHMPAGSSIVNIASVAGLSGAPKMTAYSSSKFALRGLSRSAAYDLGPLGIRVNCVCPGASDTAMMSQESREGRGVVAGLPMPRGAAPEEISAMVAYLVSDASSYSTGQDFVVDGGMKA